MKYKILAASVLFISFFMIWVPMTADILIKYWYQSHTTDIATMQQLRNEIGLDIIDETVLKADGDFKTIPEKITLFLQLQRAIQSIPEYREQKQNIMARFDKLIETYQEGSSAYSYLGLDFLDVSTSTFTFEQKKDPYAVLSNWAETFRSKVISYNQTSSTPLRFAIDPQSELERLTPREKLAQMFVFAVDGTTLVPSNAGSLSTNKIGGVVLLGANVSSNITPFITSIQSTNPTLPLFVLVDQEGGTVKRVTTDSTPGAKGIAELDEIARCNAFTSRDNLLSSLGFNWNLGIVADVTASNTSFIFPRVFGSDYENVAGIVVSAVECTTNTLSTLKHFPGHGAVEADTHQTIAHITKEQAAWEQEDLLPFKAGIEAGSDSVMLAHLYLDFLDPNNIASLSSAVVSYLRGLEEDTLIITDDMRMLDASGFDRAQALKQALLANVDVVLYSSSVSGSQIYIDMAETLLNDGSLSTESIDSSVLRILQKKAKIINSDDSTVPFELINPGHLPS